MSKWLLCGLLCTVPLWGGEHEPANTIALYTQFEYPPEAAVLAAMQNEVDNIMAPMGADLDWRALHSATGNQISSQLAVIKFLGRCEPLGPAHHVRIHALGWTHVSDGAILPFSDIDCDGIRQFLETDLLATDGRERAEIYGRAVGRVLAHELYHIFANTAHHGANGVGKAVYSVHDLLSRDFQFEERESEALRSGRPRAGSDVVNGTH